MIRIAIVNYYASKGGAAVAANRLYKSLKNNDQIDISYLVIEKNLGEDATTIFPFIFSRKIYAFVNALLKKTFFRRQTNLVNVNLLPNKISSIVKNYDVVNFHWVGNGLLPFWNIAPGKKNIYHLHDAWAFRGAEHHDLDDYYINGIVASDLLDIPKLINYAMVRRKAHALRTNQCLFIAPSNWIYEQARKSIVFRDVPGYVVRNPLSNAYFNSMYEYNEKKQNEGQLKIVLVIGGDVDNKNKGVLDFIEISNSFCGSVETTIVGKNSSKYNQIFSHCIDSIEDDQNMIKIYLENDVLLLLSNHENMPQVVIEGTALGCFILAYDVGGVSEIVDSSNGLLFNQGDVHEVIKALGNIVKNLNLLREQRCFRIHAVEKRLLEYQPDIVAKRVLELYQSK